MPAAVLAAAGLLAATSRLAAAVAPCRVTPILTGRCALGADHVLGEGHDASERIPFAIYAFLIEGPGGERALVDLGPQSVEYANAMFRRYGFFRDLGPGAPAGKRYPDDIVQPYGNVLRQLAELGLEPGDIDHIVFTHLHADHHGIHDARDGGLAERFPAAFLHLSRRGWEDNLKHRRDGRWGSYVDHAFSDFLLDRAREGKVRLAAGEVIFPGLRTLYLGGHSECSQAVVVETRQGTAIITSDEVYLYRLLEAGILPAIHTSPDRYRRALERLARAARETGGVLVPLHEPLVWKAYEEHRAGWLAALRPLSERALRGYGAAQPGRE